jgi:hypothetical protein
MTMRTILRLPIVVALATLATPLRAQQGPDTAFVPVVEHPAYTSLGPSVVIDQAHRNFHTATGNYRAFAALLRRDGYRVEAGTAPFTRASLAGVDVLVVANAMGGDTEETAGSPAFTPAERAAVREWVRAGGSLLLIADHAPFGGAAEALALEFGVDMSKGATRDTAAGRSQERPTFLRFDRGNGLLGDHPILAGRNDSERIGTVVSFTGQSLSIPTNAAVLLRLSPTAEDVARVDGQPRFTAAAGRAQGIAIRFGAGRVVVLGEAAMLSAQVILRPGQEPFHMGMNVPGTDDRQFALNVMHWLSRLI